MFECIKIVNNENFKWVVFIHGFGGSDLTWKSQSDFFSQYFNLLYINMHKLETDNDITDIDTLCDDIFKTLHANGIHKAHFLSMSSGALVSLQYGARYPETIYKMVMAGGMLSFGPISSFFLFCVRKLKNVIPYLYLYKFFAFALMPGKTHEKSRMIFVRESVKLGSDEFKKWVDLVPTLLDNKQAVALINDYAPNIPVLYLIGENDYIFGKIMLKDINRLKNGKVEFISDCGHVCSIENKEMFNKAAIEFLTLL